jgi:hypothetical protein
MLKALYYPHTHIENPVIIKNALLLWDSVDTIVPRKDWVSDRRSADRRLREAVDLVVTQRVPDARERQEAHRILEDLARGGTLSALVQASPSHWRRPGYLIYPEKFSDETWRLLQRGGMAQWEASESDYGVPVAVGFVMMSILADICAGTQLQKITDRADAYSWIAERYATMLGSQYVKGLDVSQVAPNHDRLVSLSLEVLDGRAVPISKLIEMRKRERRRSGTSYSAMRRRYLKALEEHLARVGKEARSASDVKELDRQFKDVLKHDLDELKRELGLASIKTLLSKEVALSALILAGSLLSPVAGLTALGSQVGGVGIIPLMKAAVEYRAAKREALTKHTMSWLFLGKQGRLALR